MNHMNELLHNLAIESGEVVPTEEALGEGAKEQLQELLVDETVAATEPTVAEQVEIAQDSVDLADQLDDLADRAEEIAERQAENTDAVKAEVLEVSVESLHREFSAVMRARKIDTVFKATSFESAGSDMSRLKGIAQDARRVSNLARSNAHHLRDFSAEGKITRLLTNDKGRLQKATAALKSGFTKAQRDIDHLKTEPKIIEHDGLGRWLTVGGEPITNLKKSVSEEAAWLNKAHAAVVKTLSGLKTAAAKLKADPTVTLDKLLPASMFTDINNLDTGKGELLGNITISAAPASGKVKKYKRSNEFAGPGVGSYVKAVVKGGVGGAALAIGATMGLIGLVAGGVIATKLVSSAFRDGSSKDDDTKAMSVASPADLKEVISIILDYDKYLNDFDDDAYDVWSILDEEELQKFSNVQVNAIEEAAARCAEIAEIIYDQAIYSTTQAALLLDKVA